MPGGDGVSAGTGDAVLAWTVLRHVRGYLDAWDRHAAEAPDPETEPGPFRIRVQSGADLDAAEFELLAWEDPHDADGPRSPFWRQDAMPEAFVDPDEPPLAEAVGDRTESGVAAHGQQRRSPATGTTGRGAVRAVGSSGRLAPHRYGLQCARR